MQPKTLPSFDRDEWKLRKKQERIDKLLHKSSGVLEITSLQRSKDTPNNLEKYAPKRHDVKEPERNSDISLSIEEMRLKRLSRFPNFWLMQNFAAIENRKQCSYLKCSYLNMGSHGNALAVSVFRRRARLRSRAHDFHYSIQKRWGKLRRYVLYSYE